MAAGARGRSNLPRFPLMAREKSLTVTRQCYSYASPKAPGRKAKKGLKQWMTPQQQREAGLVKPTGI